MQPSSTKIPETKDAIRQRLLLCGIIAGPLYLTVGLMQAFLRDGFDLGRHPLSILANGTGGWVQTMNFAITGLLVICASLAIGAVLRPQSRAIGWILGVFGVSMVVAAGFPADPMGGFPPGTAEGIPVTISTTGLVHFAVGALGFFSLGVAGLVAGRGLSKGGDFVMARSSYVIGVVVLLGFLSGPVLPLSMVTVGIWLSVVAGFTWLTILSLGLHGVVGVGSKRSGPRAPAEGRT